MRLHGDREPHQPFSARMSGGPNEVRPYGEQAYPILRDPLRWSAFRSSSGPAARVRGEPDGLGPGTRAR
ncbi:hypothetical protein GCM10010234_41870 [Streptomyces hawaiiensis]